MNDETEPSSLGELDQTPASQGPSEADPRIPPADFSLLVSMFSTQAMVSMGVIPEPGNDKPRAQLHLARHFIDLLGVLEEKTKGNLTERESSSLSENLHYLRMMFLNQSQAQ